MIGLLREAPLGQWDSALVSQPFGVDARGKQQLSRRARAALPFELLSHRCVHIRCRQANNRRRERLRNRMRWSENHSTCLPFDQIKNRSARTHVYAYERGLIESFRSLSEIRQE